MAGDAGNRLTLQPLDAPVWRIMAAGKTSRPCAAVSAPEGRLHHGGQEAVYASFTPEGAKVAVRRYLTDGVPRAIVPLRLKAERVADLRSNAMTRIVWQDLRQDGLPSPTWDYSDAARQSGAQAMLYASRTRPELTHVVVFDLACIEAAGPPVDLTD